MQSARERLQLMVMPREPNANGWLSTRTIMLAMFGLWIFYFLGVHMFSGALNRITVPFVNQPLDFCLAVQGSSVVFLAVLFWFYRKNRGARASPNDAAYSYIDRLYERARRRRAAQLANLLVVCLVPLLVVSGVGVNLLSRTHWELPGVQIVAAKIVVAKVVPDLSGYP